jgi:hypothetical protein
LHARASSNPHPWQSIPLPDTIQPTLALEGPAELFATAAAGAGEASVAFPAMIASDNGAVPTPTVICTGGFKPDTTLTYSVGAAALFPVGATEVSCVARDAANNPSKLVKFRVNVVCPTGYNLTAGPAGVCKGAVLWASRQVHFDFICLSPTVFVTLRLSQWLAGPAISLNQCCFSLILLIPSPIYRRHYKASAEHHCPSASQSNHPGWLWQHKRALPGHECL